MEENPQNLREICEGFAETRMVSTEKYNNLPGYTPLAKVGDRLLIGRKRDDVIEDLREQNQKLVADLHAIEQARHIANREYEVLKSQFEEKKALGIEAARRVVEQEKSLEALRQSNKLYEHDIAKIRAAVGEIYMEKILGPKPEAPKKGPYNKETLASYEKRVAENAKIPNEVSFGREYLSTWAASGNQFGKTTLTMEMIEQAYKDIQRNQMSLSERELLHFKQELRRLETDKTYAGNYGYQWKD